MPTDIVTVQLTRESEEEKWGFQISGGKDQNSPLVISEVSKLCHILESINKCYPYLTTHNLNTTVI